MFGDANRETEFIIGGGLYRRLQNFIEGIVEEFSEVPFNLYLASLMWLRLLLFRS